MAKVKIKEGSLNVELEGKNGSSHGKLDDPGFRKGEKVRVWFMDYNKKYTFQNGELIGGAAAVVDPTRGENNFRIWAATLIVLWAAAVAVLWIYASWQNIGVGKGLAEIPSGPTVVVTALVAGAGLNRTVSFLERKFRSA